MYKEVKINGNSCWILKKKHNGENLLTKINRNYMLKFVIFLKKIFIDAHGTDKICWSRGSLPLSRGI